MNKRIRIIVAMTLLAVSVSAAAARTPIRGVGEFTVPGWFKSSFLDLPDDAREAAASGKFLMVYFGQDGCPYCARLFNVNFSQKDVVDYTRKHFDAIEINMWGDRTVTDFSGQRLTEKALAAKYKVWFTPTILFFDGKGAQVLRVNGYYPPHQFKTALRYVAEGRYRDMSFSEYYKKYSPAPARGTLRPEPFFVKPPYDLSRWRDRPLAVLFEQKDCPACDAMHRDVFTRAATLKEIKRFRIVQLDRWANTPLIAPDGRPTTARAYADALGVAYLPTMVFYDGGKEVMRIDALLKNFHVQSVMDYVASGAYKREPSFQRFIQARAERLRARGVAVDLWQ